VCGVVVIGKSNLREDSSKKQWIALSDWQRARARVKKDKKPEYGIDKEYRDGRLQGTLREVSGSFDTG